MRTRIDAKVGFWLGFGKRNYGSTRMGTDFFWGRQRTASLGCTIICFMHCFIPSFASSLADIHRQLKAKRSVACALFCRVVIDARTQTDLVQWRGENTANSHPPQEIRGMWRQLISVEAIASKTCCAATHRQDPKG